MKLTLCTFNVLTSFEVRAVSFIPVAIFYVLSLSAYSKLYFRAISCVGCSS